MFSLWANQTENVRLDPIGFCGVISLIGFLLGLTVAGGTGYYYLFDDYHAASNLLLSVVEELQKSTNKVVAASYC